MESTRALSPDIRGLFDLVQHQAIEYSKAFELFEKNRRDFEFMVDQMRALSKSIREESDATIKELNTSVMDSLIILKNRTEETISNGIELKNIKQFRDDIESKLNIIEALQDKLNKQSEELDSAIKFFRKKSEMELESTLITVKSKLEREIQNESQKIEAKVGMRLKQIENVIVNIDENAKSLEDRHSNQLKKLMSEMDSIKYGYFSFTPGSGPGSGFNPLPQSSITIDDIEAKIYEYESRIGELTGKIEKFSKLLDKLSSIDIIEVLDNMEKKLFSTSRAASESKEMSAKAYKKVSSGTMLGIMGIVLGLIALIVALI